MVGILWNLLKKASEMYKIEGVFIFSNPLSALNLDNPDRILSQQAFCQFHDTKVWFRRVIVDYY